MAQVRGDGGLRDRDRMELTVAGLVAEGHLPTRRRRGRRRGRRARRRDRALLVRVALARRRGRHCEGGGDAGDEERREEDLQLHGVVVVVAVVVVVVTCFASTWSSRSVSAPLASRHALALSLAPAGSVSVTCLPTSDEPPRLARLTVSAIVPVPFEPFSATFWHLGLSPFVCSWTGGGAPSTRSLASLSPRPVSARTTLITWIFCAPALVSTTSKEVFSSGAAAPSPAAGAAATATGAAAVMPHSSSIFFFSSTRSSTDIFPSSSKILSTPLAAISIPPIPVLQCQWSLVRQAPRPRARRSPLVLRAPA